MNPTKTLPSETGHPRVIPSWLKGWKLIWILGAGVYTVVYSAWIILKWTNPAYESMIAGLGYLPLGIFAAISASYTASQEHIDRITRRAWVLIAASVISLSIADILYTVLENTIGVGFPDIPDIFYLLYYPLAFMGLIAIPTQISDPSQRKTWKLDLAVMTVSTTAILWYFIIEPTAITGGEDLLAIWVAGAYPAMDLLLLTSIASILFRKSEINTRHSLYILIIGLMFYVIADIVYAWQVLQDSYVSGSWLDLLWTFSYLFVGIAAIRQSSLHLNETETIIRPFINRQAFLAPFLTLSASVVVSVYAASTGNEVGARTSGLYFGTALAIFLTLARQSITIRENAALLDELNLATDQLRNNAQSLEARVSERTRELESQKNRLRISAQIAKDASSARDLDSLLKRSSELILNYLNLYHVAFFLVDQQREYAVLTASPTEAGRQMMASGYKVRLEDAGIVGRVASSGEPRITLDASPEQIHSSDALLPKTRSEMALPLKVEGRTIGVLDVQSDQPQAFDEDEIAIMQVLTDQMAVAIERTRLLQQVEENLRELQKVYGRSTRESWKSLAESGLLGQTGYRFDNIRIQPIDTTPELGTEAMQAGQLIVQKENGNGQPKQALAAIPVKLRGQSIGVVTVKLKENYNSNTIATIEQAVDRLAASLESARLFEEARARANREQAIAQVTSAISAAGDVDSILRTTVEEIGKSLGDSEVSIHLTENLE